MPVIEEYSFGRMSIDGVVYTKDLIIFPDGRIFSPWWRVQGHSLSAADLSDLLAMHPEYLIIGTGASGQMRPDAELIQLLEKQEMEFVALPTDKASREYNNLTGKRKTGACFHLTC